MNRIHIWLGMLAMLAPALAQAGIVITGTRVIYPGEQREITVQLTNNGDVPALAQSWIDEKPDTENVAKARSPFLLTPPVARVNPGKGQSLRIRLIEQGLPQDRESLYWLTVLELPPSRRREPPPTSCRWPSLTASSCSTDPRALARWTLASNPCSGRCKAMSWCAPTPVRSTSPSSTSDWGTGSSACQWFGHGRPRETLRLPLKGRASSPGDASVDFKVINDFGADAGHSARLQP